MRPRGGGAPWAALAGTGARTDCRGGKRHRMNSARAAGLRRNTTRRLLSFKASLLVEIRQHLQDAAAKSINRLEALPTRRSRQRALSR